MDLIPKVVAHAKEIERNEELLRWTRTARDCVDSSKRLLQGKLSQFFKDRRHIDMLEFLQYELECKLMDLEQKSADLYTDGFKYPLELIDGKESSENRRS